VNIIEGFPYKRNGIWLVEVIRWLRFLVRGLYERKAVEQGERGFDFYTVEGGTFLGKFLSWVTTVVMHDSHADNALVVVALWR